jgi:hypothetical protein
MHWQALSSCWRIMWRTIFYAALLRTQHWLEHNGHALLNSLPLIMEEQVPKWEENLQRAQDLLQRLRPLSEDLNIQDRTASEPGETSNVNEEVNITNLRSPEMQPNARGGYISSSIDAYYVGLRTVPSDGYGRTVDGQRTGTV